MPGNVPGCWYPCGLSGCTMACAGWGGHYDDLNWPSGAGSSHRCDKHSKRGFTRAMQPPSAPEAGVDQ